MNIRIFSGLANLSRLSHNKAPRLNTCLFPGKPKMTTHATYRLKFRLLIVGIICLLSAPVGAEPAVLISDAPAWNIGDTWRFHTQNGLDRTLIQGSGLSQVGLRPAKVEATLTYTVEDLSLTDGERCYILDVAGTQEITGSYSAIRLQDESSGGTFTQRTNIRGKEYRRIDDLAFVRAEMHSQGTIRFAGSLAGAPAPFESRTITTADPPAKFIKFPLVEGEKWRVSVHVDTDVSGTTTDSMRTTYSYECETLGLRTISLDNGDEYECIAISQKGTQTIRSKGSGPNVDNVGGTLFFSPAMGNIVRDEAEGKELTAFMPGAVAAVENSASGNASASTSDESPGGPPTR
jgi:hypothetical protein